ncbi:MAG: tRNA 2-thiouridine(34) synthase MnmA [Actinobacteria bacterium]|nr:tRNA 2-thiouridine(34) synthase MnmA [Actinomycetota bacterium]
MKDSKLKDKNIFFGVGEIEDSKKSICVKAVVSFEDSSIVDINFDYNSPHSLSPFLSKVCEKIKAFAQKLSLLDAVKISKKLIIKELIKESGSKKVEEIIPAEERKFIDLQIEKSKITDLSVKERSIINLPIEAFHRAVGDYISRNEIKNIFPKKDKKVLVAMSGGVDSSVSALLLTKQGYEVIGSTMRLWEFPFEEQYLKSCCSILGIWNARDVCRKLNLAHFTLDLRNNFKQKVVDYFCNQYLLGKTPNPCIMCNKYIKFGAFIDIAEKLEAAKIATGHYVSIEKDSSSNKFIIKRAKDRNKDQSYVFWKLNQEQLSKIICPLGNYKKSEIRDIAQKNNLKIASKIESQDICFIPDGNYGNFIEKNLNIKIEPGLIVDTNNNILGQHKGFPFYTIGQRKGLGISYKEPLYVKKIIPDTNTLIVGNSKQLMGKELTASDINFIYLDKLESEMKVKAKIRYRDELEPALVVPISKDRVKVIFDKPKWAITPGQSVVFYENDILVGGGIID